MPLDEMKHQQNQMGDAALSNVEETIIMKNPLVEADDRHESGVIHEAESFIPTAIVKPKYQKLSFDERQLPACVSTVDNSWHSPGNTSSTTITSTPRKVQKHLPKSQKFLAKQTRKLINKNGEVCVEYDASDKEAINSLRHSDKDIDSCHVQNSVAIVQPIKKVVGATASVNMSDGKSQKAIDSSINSAALNHKHEQKNRSSSKIIAANEIAPRMSESGNNLNVATRKAASVARDCEKKVPTKTRDQKDNSGNYFLFLHNEDVSTSAQAV